MNQIMEKLVAKVEVPCEAWLDKFENNFAGAVDEILQEGDEGSKSVWEGLEVDKVKNVRQLAIKIFEAPAEKQINCSMLDLFPEYSQNDRAGQAQDHTNMSINSEHSNHASQVDQHAPPLPLINFQMFLCLLQSGNTVDGVVISSKLLYR